MDPRGILFAGQYESTPSGGGQPSVESYATTPVINPAYAATAMVYRVSLRNFTPAPLPDFDRVSAAELVQVLQGPSHFRRIEAQRAILRRQAELGQQIAPLLESLAADRSKPLKNRVASLLTYKQLLGAASTPSITWLVGDPTIAAWALRALGDDLGQARSIPIEVVTGSLRSSDPRTRKEALITLARADSLASAPAMTPLLADSDPIVSHTAMQALRTLRAVDALLAGRGLYQRHAGPA